MHKTTGTDIISVKDLREQLPKYEQAVANGQSFTVFKRSKPVFKIVPVEDDRWEAVVDFTKVKKGGVDIDELVGRL